MKYLSLLIILGLFSFSGNTQPSFGQPDLTVDKEVHDFGTVQQNGNGVCVFTVTNNGDEPLIISKCDKTCGCTIPKCDPKPIEPGQTSKIEVSYDTKRLGPFSKSVKVHSNDPDEPLKILRIKGEVVSS